jgi:hypothetical protein
MRDFGTSRPAVLLNIVHKPVAIPEDPVALQDTAPVYV